MKMNEGLTGFCLVWIGLLLLPGITRAAEPAMDDLYSDPLPRSWPAPPYPPDALQAGVGGRVAVEFVVDAEGRVVDPVIKEDPESPADPRLKDAVLKAAGQWKFSPALDAGKPAARSIIVPVTFNPRGRGDQPTVEMPRDPDIAPTTPAQIVAQPDGPYPDELMPRKLPGTANFEFQVSAEGKVDDVKVLYASDAAFVAPGLEALRHWKFVPGRQGSLPVATGKQAAMEFSVDGEQTSLADIFAANGISGLVADQVDKPPLPLALCAPVYPLARLTAGETGEAQVDFVILESGATDLVSVLSASEPEFGESLAAAVAVWRFQPAIKSGERTTVKLRVRHAFATKDSDAESRLVAALKTGIASAKGLDRRLQPLWRMAPRYPLGPTAVKPAGQAMVDFIIDRTGRVRLPRVASATNDAFGWAAATAVSQWVFEPPMRGGQPVDVRVSIPFSFEPPAQ
jgi:TonB family protein